MTHWSTSKRCDALTSSPLERRLAIVRQLSVDFNWVIQDSLSRANARRAVPGTVLNVGSVVVVGDADWGVVEAEVVEHDLESGSLVLRLLGDLVAEQVHRQPACPGGAACFDVGRETRNEPQASGGAPVSPLSPRGSHPGRFNLLYRWPFGRVRRITPNIASEATRNATPMPPAIAATRWSRFSW